MYICRCSAFVPLTSLSLLVLRPFYADDDDDDDSADSIHALSCQIHSSFLGNLLAALGLSWHHSKEKYHSLQCDFARVY